MKFRSHTPNEVRAKGSKIKWAFYDAMDSAMNVMEAVTCLMAASWKPLAWLLFWVLCCYAGWGVAELINTP